MKCNVDNLRYRNGTEMSFLALYGNVDNFNEAINSILHCTGRKEVDIHNMNMAAKKGAVYLNEKGLAYDEYNSNVEKLARYKVVPLGYEDITNKREVCASFIKTKGWSGVFINTLDNIASNIQKNYDLKYGVISNNEIGEVYRYRSIFNITGFGLKEILKNSNNKALGKDVNTGNENCKIIEYKGSRVDSIKKKAQDSKLSDDNDVTNVRNANKYINELVEYIDSNLLFKGNWEERKKGIYNYIEYTIQKIEYDRLIVDKGNATGYGYSLSGNEDKTLINTGLIDRFNNDIYILDLDNKLEYSKKHLVSIKSKNELLEYGFKKEDITVLPKPIKYYKEKSQLIFDGSLDDVDLSDTARLTHIIEERRYRFPDIFKDVSSDVMCKKLKSAVITALKIAQRDYRYILPMYNFKHNKIQYLVPLYFDKTVNQLPPDVVAIVGRNNDNEFYSIYTIINLEDAYDNARMLSSDMGWLKI